MQNPDFIGLLAKTAPIVRYAHMEDIVCPIIEKNFNSDWSPCLYKSGIMTCGIMCAYYHKNSSRSPREALRRIRHQKRMSRQNFFVSDNVVASTDWLDDSKTGYLVNSNREDLLATAIQSLLDNPRLAEQMGDYAREQSCQKYLVNHHMEKILDLFEKTARIQS
jgi:hypothetical protein